MHPALPLAFIVGLVVASPAPFSPSTRETPYDIKLDTSSEPTYINKHPECGGILEPGCGPLHLGGSGLLAGDAGSGLLGAKSGLDVVGVHIRRLRAKRGLFSGLGTEALNGPLDNLASNNPLLNDPFPEPGQPLQGVGLKRETKRSINLGRPGKSILGLGSNDKNMCSSSKQYCCKHVRRYSDPSNVGLFDGALVRDGLLNDVLVGLSCDLVAGALAPGSCDNRVCCTSQHQLDNGPTLNLGCTPLAGSLLDN